MKRLVIGVQAMAVDGDPNASMPVPNLPQLVAWFEAGEHKQLLLWLPRLLAQQPQHAGLLKLLGASQLLCQEPAVDALQRAAEIDPYDATNWRNLGVAYRRAGDDDQALAAWHMALKIRPDDATPWSDLGLCHQAHQRWPEALAAFEQAHRLRPQALEHCRLAEALRLSGQPVRGMDVLEAARAQWPEHPQVWLTAGNLHWSLADWDQARDCYLQALAHDPSMDQAHANLGDVLRRLGQPRAALVHLQRAVELAAQRADHHSALGALHADAWQLSKAQEALQRAVELDPALSLAWCNLGNVMRDLGRPEEAAAHYQQALSIQPQDLVPASLQVLNLNYLPGALLAEHAQAAKAFDDLMQRATSTGGPVTPLSVTPPAGSAELASRLTLRVGFVSADLHAHPVGFFLAEVLPGLFQMPEMELVVFSNGAREDAVTARLKGAAHAWHSIHRMTDEQAARHIRAQGIDILLDLSGHTAGHRLGVFARRAAPVQGAWLGYFGTTGLSQMDALLADPWTVPPDLASHYRERVHCLPHTRFCMGAMPWVPLPQAPSCGHRPLTWGCFNNLAKLNNEVIDCWGALLRLRTDSRLVLKALQYDDELVREQVLQRFVERQVAAGQLQFLGASSREAHLQAYAEVDISLDPFPFNGGTSTLDSLWMGVPVLTLAGQPMAARQGLSILHNLGMHEWVAHSTAEYLERAVAFAGQLSALRGQRAQLRQRLQASPLMDAAGFSRDLASALTEVWSACRPR